MSERPPVACSVPLCPDIVVEHGRCAAHQQENPTALKRKEYDKNRPYKHLYSLRRWQGPQGLRLAVLRRDPICTECNRSPSTIADHIVDHKGDVTLFFDSKNLRGVCKPCHDRKTGHSYGPDGTPTVKAPAAVDAGGNVRDFGDQFARQPAIPSTFVISSKGDAT